MINRSGPAIGIAAFCFVCLAGSAGLAKRRPSPQAKPAPATNPALPVAPTPSNAPALSIEPSPAPTPAAPHDANTLPAAAAPPPTTAGPPDSARASSPPAGDPRTDLKLSAQVGHGVTFSAGDYFSMTLRGRMMLRYTYQHQNKSNPQEFEVRRVRLYLQGHTFSKHIQYYFHVGFAPLDFEPDSRNPLFDGYLQLTFLRDLQIRIGQQLVPFNHSRFISSQSAELVDRSIVNAELQLDRDIGIKLYSTDLFGARNRLGYELFVGTGNGRNQGAGNMGLLYVLRLQVNPMGRFEDNSESDLERDPRPRLSIGAAGAFNHRSVRQRDTTGSFYKYGDFNVAHASADLLFKWAGFSLFSEWNFRWATKSTVTGTDPTMMMPVTEYARRAHGYFVQAGYVFPRGIGIAARWSQLFPIGATDPVLITQVAEVGKEIVAGISYYFRGHVLKVQADYTCLFGADITGCRHSARVQLHVGY